TLLDDSIGGYRPVIIILDSAERADHRSRLHPTTSVNIDTVLQYSAIFRISSRLHQFCELLFGCFKAVKRPRIPAVFLAERHFFALRIRFSHDLTSWGHLDNNRVVPDNRSVLSVPKGKNCRPPLPFHLGEKTPFHAKIWC